MKQSKITLKPGETYELLPKWMPAIYPGDTDFSFKSKDESIATVDDMGLITPVAESGTVKIKILGEGKKKTVTVTIGEPAAEEITE